MFAVIETQGHQYKVQEKDVLKVDKVDLAEKEKFVVKTVLMISDGKKVEIGKPYLDKASVECTVVKHFKGEKIRVYKKKPKTHYSRTQGFRAELTELRVEKILRG